jgi:hypothetical protein
MKLEANKFRNLIFAISLAAVALNSIAARYLGRYGDKAANLDFWAYYFAAQTVRDNPHAVLYLGATAPNPQVYPAPADSDIGLHAARAGFPRVMQFVYPPMLADALAPLSRLSPETAATIWRVFNLLCLGASILMIARLIGIRWLSFEFAALFLAAFSFYPIHEALDLGQIAVPMLGLWTLSILAYKEGHVVFSACVMALATGLKVTPVLVLPLFILWKDRRWLIAYFTAGFGLLAALAATHGVAMLHAFVQALTRMSGVEPAELNKNIGSILAWIYYGRLFDQDSMVQVISAPAPMLSIASKVVSAAFLLGCLYPIWKSRARMGRAGKANAIAVIAMATLAISPVSWRHGYAIAFLPLAMAWAGVLRQRAPLWQSLVLGLTTISIGAMLFERAAALPLPVLAQIFFASLWVLSSVAFCLTALWQSTRASDTTSS